MQIHIIRHGMTSAIEKGLYYGQTDLPLSERGISGIKDLINQDIYPNDIGMFFTSGLCRTVETLELIYGSIQSQAIPELKELNLGQFEMKSHDELAGRRDYQNWINDSTGFVICPGGESRQQFIQRIMTGFDLLLDKSRNVENSLVVSHGGVISSIMGRLFPNVQHFYGWQPEPGRGYTLIYKQSILKEYKEI